MSHRCFSKLLAFGDSGGNSCCCTKSELSHLKGRPRSSTKARSVSHLWLSHKGTQRHCQSLSKWINFRKYQLYPYSLTVKAAEWQNLSARFLGWLEKMVLTVRNSGGWTEEKSVKRAEVETGLKETTVWEDPRMTHTTLQISWSGLFCKHKATTLCWSVASFINQSFRFASWFPKPYLCSYVPPVSLVLWMTLIIDEFDCLTFGGGSQDALIDPWRADRYRSQTNAVLPVSLLVWAVR